MVIVKIKTCLLSTFIFCYNIVFSQAGVGSGAYCMPDYWNKPCAQPNVSNDPWNYVNDFIDAFNTTGGVTNINTVNSGCQSQMIAGTLQNYFRYDCSAHLRGNAGAVITCNFLSGVIFSQGFAVFVDWNKDCDFSTAERVCATPNVPSAATWASANFTIPATTATGAYRLRVRSSYATPGTSIDPCPQYSYGETHDYTLFVGSACDATMPVCSGLPILLLSFDGYLNGSVTDLDWATAVEHNNSYFTIEKSRNGENFEFFARVKGAGNSNYLNKYSVTDYDPHYPITYYKLKQFDEDGTMWESKIISVNATKQVSQLTINPNPVDDKITFSLPEIYSSNSYFNIINSAGQIIFTMNEMSEKTEINVSKFPKGIYIINVYSKERGIAFGKFVKH
jgi:hypothetical protein